MTRLLNTVLLCGLLGLFAGSPLFAQDSSAPSGNPPQQAPKGVPIRNPDGPRPIFGKIIAIHTGSFEINRPDGQTLTVRLTDQTEYRKDREPAAFVDFKVGDTIMVRGDENPDRTVTAKHVGTRSGGPAGPANGGPRGGAGVAIGTLGKDYVVGEVKAIDAPRLTVLRPDNVSQTIELNENTSLRKGRESITMADIQVGDHVMARGGLHNDLFVPLGVMVMNPEQWRRMQEMRSGNSGSVPVPTPNSPATDSSVAPSKPSEPPN